MASERDAACREPMFPSAAGMDEYECVRPPGHGGDKHRTETGREWPVCAPASTAGGTDDHR